MYARTFSGEIYVINYIYTRILASFLQLCCRKREENSMGKTSKQKKTKADKFIMLPTVDFCFKELMQDKKVRKGLIAALLNVKSDRSGINNTDANNSKKKISGG